jgi:16S rRNA (uracil1498-N3)-methyltransferase
MRLPDAPAHHVARVLRLRVGDPVVLFDGAGGEVPATLMALDRGMVEVLTGERQPTERESLLPVTLVQALQSGDKMDFTVQKAVELGVTRIVPVLSRRSVVKLDGARAEKRVAHWRQVAAGACEQCGRNRLPDIDAISGLDRWLASPSNDSLRLLLLPGATETLASLPAPRAVTLLIGPEGGLSEDEVSAALTARFFPVRLGPRVLRTETAGLAALAAINLRWGDFQ